MNSNTSTIKLIPFTLEDSTLLCSWVDSPRLLLQFSGTAFTYPLTENQLLKNMSDVKRTPFIVIDSESKEKVGYAEVYKVNAKTSKLARIIISSEYRGLGYGKELIQALLSYCFIKLKSKQVILNVYESNSVAIACYNQFGFIKDTSRSKLVDFEVEQWKSVGMILKSEDWRQRKFAVEPNTI